MSADLAIKLRLLAQDYHDGRLDLPTYRALRAPILNSLVLNVYSVKAAMEATQPRAAARPVDTELTQPGKPLAQPRERPSSPPAKSRHLLVVASAIFLLIAVAVAAVVWRGVGSRDGDTSNAGTSAAREEGGIEAVRRLIDEFADRGDWSEARLAPLNAALLELGSARMAAAAQQAWFQRFVDELRSRLKEQQALATAPLTADNSPLAALAVTVGFDLKAPDAAIHIASLPAPVVPATSPSLDAHGVSARDVAGHPVTQAARDRGTQGAGDEGSEPTAGAPTASAPTASAPTSTAPTASGPTASGPRTGAPTAGVNASGGASASSGATSSATAAPAGSVGANGAQNTCRLELIRSRRPLCEDSLPGGVEGPLMAMLPAGAFDMGSNAAAEEQPVHRVTIREPFAISVYEVSQGDFKQFCEHTKRVCAPQPWVGDDYPAVSVSWDDARAYAEWLSIVTHHRYSLPTEAQWEYAARAGQAGPFPGGDSLSPTDAHYSMLAKQTSPARRSQKFNANAFRLVHTVGNVREWVEDGWEQNFAGASSDGSAMKSASGAMRVARGGSFTDGAARLRLSMREALPATTRDTTTGFRVVRELP